MSRLACRRVLRLARPARRWGSSCSSTAGQRRPVGTPVHLGRGLRRRDLRLRPDAPRLRRRAEPVAAVGRQPARVALRQARSLVARPRASSSATPASRSAVRPLIVTYAGAARHRRRRHLRRRARRRRSRAWAMWQKRGTRPSRATEIETSDLRPSAREEGLTWPRTDANPPMPAFPGDYVLAGGRRTDDLTQGGQAEAVPPHRPVRVHHVRGLRRHLPVEVHPHARHRRHQRGDQHRSSPAIDPDDHVVFVVDEDVCTRCGALRRPLPDRRDHHGQGRGRAARGRPAPT